MTFFSDDGQDPLSTIYNGMMARMSKASFTLLEHNLNSLLSIQTDLGGSLPLGTGCSGTDLISLVTLHLYGALRDALGKELICKHLWSCERNSVAQKFISEIINPPAIFNNMADLGQEKAYCVLHKNWVTIQWILEFACGFSCTSVSKQNNDSVQARTCIEDRTHETGRTFGWCMDFILQHLPLLVILENVRMGMRNRQAIREKLMAAGYVFFMLAVDTRFHGSPHSRPRLWMGAMLCPHATPEDYTSIQEHAESLEREFRQPALPLEAFLLSTDDDDYAEYEDSVLARKRQKLSSKQKWRKLHHSKGWDQLQMNSEVSPLLRFRPTERERQLLLKDHNENIEEYQSESIQHIILDTSQTGTRMPRSVNGSPCLLPGSELVETKTLKRPVFGVERLAMQGLHRKHSKTRLTNFTHRQLCTLAGNSFSGNAALLSKVICLIALPWPTSAEEITQRQRAARKQRQRAARK